MVGSYEDIFKSHDMVTNSALGGWVVDIFKLAFFTKLSLQSRIVTICGRVVDISKCDIFHEVGFVIYS
jgi:hypothetical protein